MQEFEPIPDFGFDPDFQPEGMFSIQEAKEKEMAETMRQNRELQEKNSMEFNFEPTSMS